MLVEDFDYALPDASIAQVAIEPRDHARLLDTTTMSDLVFTDIVGLLRPNDLLVVNTTRVRAARLEGTKHSGGRAEVLLTKRIDEDRWQVLVRPARRLRTGSTIVCGPLTVTLLSDPSEGIATAMLDGEGDTERLIEEAGSVPLPPYFRGTLDDPERYQTMFADRLGSSAAPTAALHFTPAVVDTLVDNGCRLAGVELEVGLDTFRPMSGGTVEDHRIHSERIRVPPATVDLIADTRSMGGRVVAVGTTVVRTLESAVDDDGRVSPRYGETDLFIRPGHEFLVVDAVITNFHAPRTTLLVLIAALLGPRWRDAYEHALGNGYRFLSFGDAMWIDVGRS